ncbi:MAG: TonB-dependent receptor [Burkholderiales bacterium]|uniref:TonB-dependent receptor n=1 Tax=Inhella sp. TaxID=1921806 RepID=UPI001AD49755|nr:TonB-dependent receptor [Burkholderiales bacterium]
MSHRRHPPTLNCLVLALLAATAQAQQAPVQQLERVEVTGSSIKRIQKEGATPVQLVSREMIERSGASNLGELLISNPAFSGADDSAFSLGPTLSGSQGAAVHGFGNADTLVLLNGRRLAAYPVGGSYVDLNSIPLDLIERIEILRDGASALYGSDAVAGVVNVITKRELRGYGVALSAGQSSRSDGDRLRGSISAGWGDLGRDAFNVMLGAEVERIDRIFTKDRPETASADLRPFGLGDDRLPTSPEPNVYFIDDNRYAPILPCKAPLPAEGVEVESAQPGKVCAFDPNTTTLLQPKVESRAFFAALNAQLPGDNRLRVEFFDKRKESGNFLNPQPMSGTVLAADPINPYGVNVIWLFRPVDPRLFRRKDVEVGAQRLLASLEGVWGDFDWTATVARASSDYTERGGGYFINSLFTAALRNRVINPFTGKLNPDDLVPLTATPVRTAETTLEYADFKLSGPVAKLGGRDVLMATGAGYTQEAYRNTPDPLQVGGLLRSDPQLALVNADRKIAYLFTEAIVPLAPGVEVQAALRYDKYSKVGSTTNPKVSLRWELTPQWLLRSSIGRGFRAPTLEDLFASDTTGFPNVIDFQGCASAGISPDNCTPKQIFTAVKSNPALKPEKTRANTLGLAWAPVPEALLSVDWISLDKRDAIAALDVQTILDNPDLPVAGYGVARNLVRRLANGQIDPDTSTPAIIAPTANLAAIRTRLLDLGVRWDTRARGVKWRVENRLTRLLKREAEPAPGIGFEEWSDLAGFAKWRNSLSLNADLGAWSGGLSVNSIASFLDASSPAGVTAGTRRVPSWTTADLRLGYKGLLGKDSSLELLVKNVSDEPTPLSIALNTATKVDFNHSAVGRFYQLSLRTKF